MQVPGATVDSTATLLPEPHTVSSLSLQAATTTGSRLPAEACTCSVVWGDDEDGPIVWGDAPDTPPLD